MILALERKSCMADLEGLQCYESVKFLQLQAAMDELVGPVFLGTGVARIPFSFDYSDIFLRGSKSRGIAKLC